jgi:Undecaprenyl-phosphate glucose phosphotransferase
MSSISQTGVTAQSTGHPAALSEATPRSARRVGISYAAIAPLLGPIDAAIIVFSSVAGGAGYQLATHGNVGDLAANIGLGLIASLAYGAAALQLGHYRLQALLQKQRDYGRILASWLLVALFLTVILFLLKLGSQFSRGSVISFVVIAAVSLVVWRGCAKRLFRRGLTTGAVRGRRAILVGAREELASLNSDYLLFQFGIDEITRVALPRHDGKRVSELERAAVETAVEHARESNAQEMVVCTSWDSTSQLRLLREMFRVVPLPVRLLPDRFIRSILGEQTADLEQPFLLDLQRAPLSRTERIGKRAFDLAIATLSLIVLSPLMIVIAIALKLDSSGPIIFRQRRKGFNGREFFIYKFRTMTVLEDGPRVQQAGHTDSRVTRFGRILRQTSIDELPQLINVLIGTMSIVGPRPHAVCHDDEYGRQIGNYAFRHHVKPGITGWAQVNGFRGGTPRLEQMQKRIDLDLWYISNWSIGLDLQICMRTCFELLRGRNAY